MIPQGGGSVVLVASMSANVSSRMTYPITRVAPTPRPWHTLTPAPDRQHPAAADAVQLGESWCVPRVDVFLLCRVLKTLAAVKHMAASLAVEWAKKGVRVNCLRYVPSTCCVIPAKPVTDATLCPAAPATCSRSSRARSSRTTRSSRCAATSVVLRRVLCR